MNKINKKKAILVALLIIVLIIWMGSFVLADSYAAVVPSVTLNSLGVTNVGLLPSNPFYFSEQWMDSFQKVFATDPVSQSKLELQILNNKAGELLASSQLSPADPSAVNTAVSNYSNELQTMGSDVQNINTKDPEVDAFLSTLTAKLYLHYALLEQIGVEYGDNNGQIASTEQEIETIIDSVPNYLTNSSNFQGILNNAVTSQTDLGAQLRALPFLYSLQENNSNQSVQSQIDQVQQSESLQFEGRYDADGLSPDVFSGILQQLPVGDINKIVLLGDLQNFVVDGTLGSYLDGLNNNMIAQASSSEELSASDVSNLTAYAGSLIADIGAGQKSEAKEISEASSSLAQAKTDLANDLYGIAFSEAQSAAYGADDILLSSEESGINSTSSVANLSAELSALENTAVSQGLANTNDPKLFTLLDNVYSTLSNNPSVAQVYQVDESLDEITFALNNAAAGIPSALIPVPGETSLENNPNSASALNNAQPGTAEYCSESYAPVCGLDGITYPNGCFEALANVTSSYKGECEAISTTTPQLPGSTATTTSPSLN